MPEENIEEAAEVALEAAQEEAREHGGHRARWMEHATLSTMAMALFSVVGALLAGITGNEALIDRQKQLQELGGLNRTVLDAEVLSTRLAILDAMNQTPDPALLKRFADKKKAAEVYKRAAAEDTDQSQVALEEHELFAISTTILSVAITLTGMAVIVRRRSLWVGGVAISLCGAAILVYGVARMVTS